MSAPHRPVLRPTGSTPVVVEGLVRSYATRAGGRPVLDGLDLVVTPGTRLGLIGENGTGKSTLLRLLAGVDVPEAGTITAPRDLVYLPQEPEVARARGTVGDLLAGALRPLREGVAEVERLAVELADGAEVATAYDAALAWAVQHDAWDADRRTEVAATGLGVADLDRARPLASLSGGQRTRLALAAALVRRPACLLLDEPTNHLDDEALALLEQELGGAPGVVIAASHDRTFLDHACSELLDLDPGALGTDGSGGGRFGGSFTAYLDHQAAARRRWEETWRAQQDEIDELRERSHRGTEAIAHDRGPRDNDKFIVKFKGGNVERARARRVNDAQRRLQTAEREAVRKPRAPLRFSGSLTGPSGTGVAATVRDLRVDGRVHVERLDVSMGEKVLVTGPNGSGKSSLLAVLHGDLVPDAGRVEVVARRVGLVAQDPDLGAPDRPASAVYVAAVGPSTAEAVPLRSLGLLPPSDDHTPVGHLSVGQRRRLSLAIAVAAAPDLLLLDEPTNHLSLRLASELEDALATAPGAVVVTSHDRWLRERWTGPVLALDGRPAAPGTRGVRGPVRRQDDGSGSPV